MIKVYRRFSISTQHLTENLVRLEVDLLESVCLFGLKTELTKYEIRVDIAKELVKGKYKKHCSVIIHSLGGNGTVSVYTVVRLYRTGFGPGMRNLNVRTVPNTGNERPVNLWVTRHGRFVWQWQKQMQLLREIKSFHANIFSLFLPWAWLPCKCYSKCLRTCKIEVFLSIFKITSYSRVFMTISDNSFRRSFWNLCASNLNPVTVFYHFIYLFKFFS